MNIEAMIAKAEELIESGDLNQAEGYIDAAMVKLKSKHKFTIEHDDGNDVSVASTGSETSDDAPDPEDEDMGDGEEDEEPLGKAATASAYDLQSSGGPDRPGALSSSTHPSSDNSRHKFEAMVDETKRNNRGITASEAMSQTRMKFPDVYASYQRHIKSGLYSKRASDTWESTVSQEMVRAGVTEEIAKVRVAQLHGFPALQNRMFKGTDTSLVDSLQKRAADIADATGCSMTEGLRAARLESPSLYKALRL